MARWIVVLHCTACFRFLEVIESRIKSRHDSVVTVTCPHCDQDRDYSVACFFEIPIRDSSAPMRRTGS